jgi:hypothetical protein
MESYEQGFPFARLNVLLTIKNVAKNKISLRR